MASYKMSKFTLQDVKTFRSQFGEEMTGHEIMLVYKQWKAYRDGMLNTTGIKVDYYPTREIFTAEQEVRLHAINKSDKDLRDAHRDVVDFVPLKVLEDTYKEKQDVLNHLQDSKV
jgi:hypothetical protein